MELFAKLIKDSYNGYGINKRSRGIMKREIGVRILNKEPDVQNGQNNKRKPMRVFWGGMACGMLLCILIGGIILLAKNAVVYIAGKGTAVTSADVGYESVVTMETLQKMQVVENVLWQSYYGEPITEEKLQEGIYRGMVAALGDPYSEYYSKEELEDALSSNQGISYGIGAYITLDKVTGMPMISSVMEQSPALEAGLRGGDVIYKVNGEDVAGYSLSKTVSLVKGKEGTPVVLTVFREGEPELLEIEAVRGKLIETETVNHGLVEDADGIGYLQITEFDGVTVDQFNEAMAELRAEGIKGLILDLRSNPGGDLSAVVDVARRILPEGMIVYTEDKAGKKKEYTCNGEYELDIPLVVLINEYSASASEILAGAIKDYNKGTLIGTTTYGKGIVQRINRLEDGTAIKLTVSAYYTPSGNNIHGIGIKPDIEIEYDYNLAEEQGIDNQLDKAIEILEGKIN